MRFSVAGCQCFSDVLKILKSAREMLNEVLSAYEFLDHAALGCSLRHLKLLSPVKECPFYVLVEIAGSNSEHDGEKLNRFLEATMGSGLVMDGTLSSDPSKMKVQM